MAKCHLYTYKIVREDLMTGEQGKRIRSVATYSPLTIDGLYINLEVLSGNYPGCYRVLELIKEEEID